VPVEQGTTGAGHVFALTTANPITINTTALTFKDLVLPGGKLTFPTTDGRECAVFIEDTNAYSVYGPVLHAAFNLNGIGAGVSQYQKSLTMPAAAFTLEHSASDAADHDKRLTQTHFPYWISTIARIISTNKEPFNLANGDTLVLKVDGGSNITATIQPGDITVGAATATQLKTLIERDIVAAGNASGKIARYQDGRIALYKIPSATAGSDSVTVVSGTIATVCGLAVSTATGAQVVNRAGEVKTNHATFENVVTFNGSFLVYNSSSSKRRINISDTEGAGVITWGDTSAPLSIASVEKIDIDVGASSVWRATSGTLTLGGATGVYFTRGGVAVADIGGTSSNNLTLAAGKSLSGLAGTGGLSLGSMTGNTALPTGNLSWAGATDVACTLTASGTGAVGIETATGTINIGTATGARTINVGTDGGAGAQTINIGSLVGGSTTTVRGQSGGLMLQASFGTIKLRNSSTTVGIDLTQASGTDWNATGQGGIVTLNWTNLSHVITGGLTVNSGTTAISLGADATNKTITLGSTSNTSATTFDSGTGTVNAWTSASARAINVGTGNAIQTLNLCNHATPVNVINIGGAASITTFGSAPVVPTFTVAGVPNAATWARGIIYVSNEAGGAVLAFSDGTNWRRVTDRAIVS
jgi:hypothetical protein